MPKRLIAISRAREAAEWARDTYRRLQTSRNRNILPNDTMSHDSEETMRLTDGAHEWSLLARYPGLTICLGVPLLLSFAFARNLYPFAASTMMRTGGDLHAWWTY